MTALDPRILELLADRALLDLDADDFAELNRRSAEFSAEDELAFDAAVGALSLAFEPNPEPMPADLRRRLLALAEDESRVDRRSGPSIAGSIAPAARPAQRFSGPAVVGWVAAAMLLVVAIVGWRDNFAPPAPPAPGGGPVAVDPAALRQSLIATGAEPIEWGPWTEASETPQAAGDIVWSDDTNTGVMRLVGLPANDASRPAYQLWIIDEDMGFDRRVSGGVFTVEPGQTEVLVPIDPAHPIDHATIFAITIENEGGVGVSTMERKALVAAVQS